MSTYLFITGKDSALSIAELEARFPTGKIDTIGDEFVVMEVDKKINQDELNMLGGIIKIGAVLGESDSKSLADDLVECLMDGNVRSKINYGISLYGNKKIQLRSLLISLKKKLQKNGVSSRFANQNFKNISTAQYKGLKKKGVELLAAKDGDRFIIAKVIANQDIDSYSRRDYYKPFRDMRVGMLPPKLAQIMINLAGDVGKIWDPFCGGGVLVMEGLLMKHEMMGSDISQANLDGAIKNVDWLQVEYNFRNRVDLFVHDATKPLPDKEFDAIVCEGYLGPPQNYIQSADRLNLIIDELEKLYVGFFTAIKEIGFKGPIVIALPFFRIKGKTEFELKETVEKIKNIGFVLKTEPLKYAREDQAVGRAIYQFSFIN
ncbi:hypothetical protein JW758_00105 [Candidatus Peregrinibacteria bacterium]|nr:hypothetical protein [Candidatus Peregrinibacteria bacterium]